MKFTSAALCVAVVALFAGSAVAQTDADVLNFALQLECLEYQFYECAAYGPSSINATLLGGGPMATGCQKANLTNTMSTLEYVQELAANEQQHVADLRAALGSAAVACPAINLGTAFAAVANAAAGMTLNPPFSPYQNDLYFLHAAYVFEPLGVSAYYGAVPLIKAPAVLNAAAGIALVEAFHTGIVNTLLFAQQNVTTPYGLTVAQFTTALANLQNKVDGNMDAQPLTATANGMQTSILAPVNSMAMAFARTPAQVLAIATLGSTNGTGGFYPNGLNGYFGPMGAGAPTPSTSMAGR